MFIYCPFSAEENKKELIFNCTWRIEINFEIKFSTMRVIQYGRKFCLPLGKSGGRKKVEMGSLRDGIWGGKLYSIIFIGAFPLDRLKEG